MSTGINFKATVVTNHWKTPCTIKTVAVDWMGHHMDPAQIF